MNLLPGLSAFSVFLGIGAIGFLILVVSLFFGELFEHFDSALGDDHGGPGFFSTRVMSVFITAFGGFGAIATHYDFSPLPASGIAFVGGAALATPIFYFAKFLYGQQATSEVRSQDLVGQIGRVIVAIPAGGVGQVRFKLGEELIDKIARVRGPHALADNATVVVEEVVGETIIVRER